MFVEFQEHIGGVLLTHIRLFNELYVNINDTNKTNSSGRVSCGIVGFWN